MSRGRSDFKNALRSLDVSKPLRIPPQLGFTEPKAVVAPDGIGFSRSSNRAQSLSEKDSVKVEQSQVSTLSKEDSIQSEVCQVSPVSKLDSVKTRGETQNSGRAPVVGNFTRVPNFLLRGVGRFSDPIDFMIYLHLFTYSHGFGRNEASMSQAQLEKFTGATKNTVKRSVDRLVAEGLIKCVEEYEYARMSRKYKVLLPRETLSSSDSVQNSQGSSLSETLSKLNPVTVSKMDTYKETNPKENLKNSLSIQSELIQRYFSELKPFRKRENEQAAFQGLKTDFSEKQIEDCLGHLQKHGMPGSGESCHSPMACLSIAMQQVLDEVTAAQEKARLGSERERRNESEARGREERETQEARDLEAKAKAFERAFPGLEEQSEVIIELCKGYPFGRGPAARIFAIGRWWEGLSIPEREALVD